MPRFLAMVASAVVLSLIHLWGASEIEGEPIVSPDGTLELYESPEAKLYGTKLYLRQRGSHTRGILLRENDRWMDVRWLPNSNGLIAIEDHFDPDATDVLIFRVRKAAGYLHCSQIFSTPDSGLLGVHWTIEWFDVGKRVIHLRMEGANERPDLQTKSVAFSLRKSN